MANAGVVVNKVRTSKQQEYGQFFTPVIIAEYMASLFDTPKQGTTINLLDPGAGEGTLGMATINRFAADYPVDATFTEIEPDALEILRRNLDATFADAKNIKYQIDSQSFVKSGIHWYEYIKRYSHIIINPPYFKLAVSSADSRTLRSDGITVTNMYAAFVWLAVRLLDDDGELVAIIPRSFCNGPYFAKFREFIFSTCSLEKIHIFNARDKAFSDDGVLQENVIIHLKRGKQSQAVLIARSNERCFDEVTQQHVDKDLVFHPADKYKVLHIPDATTQDGTSNIFVNDMGSLGINVSTGPVVDFRLRDSIYFKSDEIHSALAPLIYPVNMSNMKVLWPVESNKKGQYFTINEDTRRWLVPLDGYHVIVRRFSSKEERRRVFAAVVDPAHFNSSHIAYENHVNFFHIKKSGLDKLLAYGLCAFLNSELVDRYFRTFSGHTQVNVSDLKRLKYPGEDWLRKLGSKIEDLPEHNESDINRLVEEMAT